MNIIIMNVLQYIENIYISNGTNNWWINLVLILVIAALYLLHYVLALVIPILFYKIENKFNSRICLLSILSVLIANVVMLFEPGEPHSQVSLSNIPHYMMRPICITMVTVIIVSILILVKQRRDAMLK